MENIQVQAGFFLVKASLAKCFLPVGIASIGMIFGGLVTGPLINSFGRRLACVLGIALVFSVSYSLWLVASHVIMLYIARWERRMFGRSWK